MTLDRKGDRSRSRRHNPIPEQHRCRQKRNDLPHFVAHSIPSARILLGGIQCCGYEQQNANGRAVSFSVLPVLDHGTSQKI
jgi:hypothetical protein